MYSDQRKHVVIGSVFDQWTAEVISLRDNKAIPEQSLCGKEFFRKRIPFIVFYTYSLPSSVYYII